MTNYPYRMQLVVDPDNPRNVVAAGSVSIYDSSDTARTTLLALTDPSGVPIPNPITSNANGFTPPFVTTSPEVLWVSGPYTDYFQSYKGMRDEAVAAKTAAENAAATAGAEAAAVAEAAIGTATDASTAAAAAAAAAQAEAEAAAQAAANVAAETAATFSATYVGLKQAAKNPDLLIAGAITRNSSDVITSAAVVWPDGTVGTFTTDAIDVSGAVNGYHITYGSPATKTFTQPTVTRNANGAATNVPQIVVS